MKDKNSTSACNQKDMNLLVKIDFIFSFFIYLQLYFFDQRIKVRIKITDYSFIRISLLIIWCGYNKPIVSDINYLV